MRGLSSTLHFAFSHQADAQDMATVKTWLASAVLVGGAGGGAAAVLTTTGESAPVASALPAAAAPDAGYLQQQIDSLLKEDHALKRAVARARVRLAGQVHAGEHSLAVLHRRILVAQAELAQAQAARAHMTPVAVAQAPGPAPVAHTTSGASGAGSERGDGEHEGGHDD